jgi:hypothetical protein
MHDPMTTAEARHDAAGTVRHERVEPYLAKALDDLAWRILFDKDYMPKRYPELTLTGLVESNAEYVADVLRITGCFKRNDLELILREAIKNSDILWDRAEELAEPRITERICVACEGDTLD